MCETRPKLDPFWAKVSRPNRLETGKWRSPTQLLPPWNLVREPWLVQTPCGPVERPLTVGGGCTGNNQSYPSLPTIHNLNLIPSIDPPSKTPLHLPPLLPQLRQPLSNRSQVLSTPIIPPFHSNFLVFHLYFRNFWPLATKIPHCQLRPTTIATPDESLSSPCFLFWPWLLPPKQQRATPLLFSLSLLFLAKPPPLADAQPCHHCLSHLGHSHVRPPPSFQFL